MSVLRAVFDRFLDSDEWDGPLGGDFARFRAERGELLRRHACFEALHAEQMPHDDWRSWPEDLRAPTGPAATAFCAGRAREVLFYSFLQWVADRSLAFAQSEALAAGMRIGLIGDLAIGMSPSGSHAWSHHSDVLPGLHIGAPPDLLNPRGQDWGLTSFSPRALEDTGFSAFIETLRAVMRNVGGIRIDHAMGLARLWVIPQGAEPADGAYLNYPVGDLLRLLALESLRHGTIVIGEDLGTVPAGFREMLEQGGVHGTRALWFEREPNGQFRSPRGWDRNAVAMTSTHDLPTVAGWWKGQDIDIRSEFGRLGDGVDVESVRAARESDRPALWAALNAEALVDGSPPGPDEPQLVVDAVTRFVGRTEVPLSLVPIEDLLGQVEQPNLPGTVTEYPNWRMRLPMAANAVVEDPVVRRRIEALAAERPRL
jgi:4-alpha-glucanotransferase